MPQPEPTPVPLTVTLTPAAARALFAHEPSEELLHSVLRQIASGAPPTDTPTISYTTSVDPHLLQQAQQAAQERGTTLDEAIVHLLLREPVLLPPARLARLLHVEKSTLNRALANNEHAPQPARPQLYDAGSILSWWPTRRRSGRPPGTKNTPRDHLD